MSDEFSFADLMASSIHDMKNALNLQAYALEKIAVQCQDKGDTSTYASLAPLIVQSQRMGLELVDMLSLYKLGKSIYPLDMDEQAVRNVLNEATLQTRFATDFKGLVLSVDCADDCYWYLDKELVQGALVNAINNATSYAQSRIHLSASLHNKQLELRVEDDGPGFPPALLHSDLTGSKGVDFASGSTGLGLYFCHQVAQLHKNGPRRGMLHIENGGSLGGGCFVLTLP